MEHSGGQQQDRRKDPDGLGRWEDPDGKGAHSHEQHGDGQDLLAADPVAERAEEHAAERAEEECSGEGGEGGEELYSRGL